MPTTAFLPQNDDTIPLEQRIVEAVANRATPISQLLRLVTALESDADSANENRKADLRQRLRARIGAPLSL